MTITLYRSSCILWRGDQRLASWEQYRFEPPKCAMQTTPGGFDKIRSTSVPLLVHVPIGSRLERGADGHQRLIVHFNRAGLDATSVAHLATMGARGIRLVGTEVTS